jgi:NitT/TauT family transport system permease protein/taurine transport system permease protein
MAWYKKIDLFIRPVFDLIRPVPGLAWIPLMILLFGIGITSKIVTVFLSAFVPCVLNSYTGVRQTKDVHLWVGQTFGASNFQMLMNIAVPTARPLVMTGVRVALGASWTCIVAAEMLASTRGLGYMIQQARGIYRPDIIICGMIAIGAIGAVFSWILTVIEKKVVKGAGRE